MSIVTTTQVIILGRVDRREFNGPLQQCTEMLTQLAASYEFHQRSFGEPIDFAFFFQSYPHEFLQSELLLLRRSNPFAPFFFILGTCCEGMLRTAGPLDSPFYCYAHAWSPNVTEQIRLFLSDLPSLFSLPITTENDEIALWHNPCSATPSPRPNLPSMREGRCTANTLEKCLILTQFEHFGNDYAMNQFLADEQSRLGFAPVFSEKQLETPFLGKIVASADNAPCEKISESIQRLRQRFADNDFTVYVDSPRINEKEDYLRAGATRILPTIRFY